MIRKILIIISVLYCLGINAQPCLNYSTFFGQLQLDEIKGICSDPQSNVYVIGNTYNTNLPITAGAFQSTLKGSYESFIAKFDSCDNLIWCSYFGTSGFDNAEKIAYSNDNSIVFCGHTDGTDLDTTSGCFQSVNNGSNDCFLAKFSLSGAPIWITYFGASGGDFAYDIETDSLNNIVIGGTSISPTLYTTPTSFQQNLSGATDAFIARFNSKGALKFSTFYGGTSSEDIHAITIDKHCNIIGVGGSFSPNLSTSAGCYQSSYNGGMEAYVIKLDSSGQRIFSTYIGNAGTDDAYGVCTDNLDYIYVSGQTNSSMFYTSTGAFQSVKSLGNDGYCLSLSPTGIMLWSTFLGGNNQDFMNGIHINKNKELILLLNSQSTNFPMLGIGNNTVNAGAADAVIVKMLTNGTPFWSAYLGGSVTEIPSEAVSVSNKKVIIAGSTTSSDFPTFGNVYQTTFNGTQDGFISVMTTETSTLSGVSELKSNNCVNSIFYDSSKEEISFENRCNKKITFIICDILGRAFLENSKTENKIDVAFLPKGVYILQYSDKQESGRKYLKFVKN
jgi:hypothetical protein